ncbi:Xylose operon regulatory protein [Burkholderia cepacia]|nr:Xylose operon regulatory protein [Burkholderia cepacia]
MTRAPSSQTPHRIALLFNANKVYDREIISGIGQYLRSTRVVWDLFLEDDFRCRLAGIEHFDGDGIIADFDDPAVATRSPARRCRSSRSARPTRIPRSIRTACRISRPTTRNSCRSRTRT